MGSSYSIGTNIPFVSKDTHIFTTDIIYDTKDCKPGCIQKVYNERKDSLFENALKNSSIFNIPLILLSIYGKNDVGTKFSLFPIEIIDHITLMYIEYSIQERILNSFTLVKPWKLSSRTLECPDECVYKNHKSYYSRIKNNDHVYIIYNYFWVDDIYHTDICKCPL